MAENIPPTVTQVKVEDAPDQLVEYANASQFTATPEELIMQFAIRDTNNPEVAKAFAKIYLSLPHAKRIAAALVEIIKNYEQIFGVVDSDPGRTAMNKENTKSKELK